MHGFCMERSLFTYKSSGKSKVTRRKRMSDKKRIKIMSIRRRMFITAVMGLFMVTILTYGFYTGYRINDVYLPLADAAMEIKYEVALAHLWFEEVASGDHDEKIDVVLEHLDRADWYARAILDGGTNTEGIIIPFDDTGLREAIRKVDQDLNKFRALFIQFTSGSAVTLRTESQFREHDDLFISLDKRTDEVESVLQNIMKHEMQNFKRTQILLIAITILLFVLTGKVSWRYERNRLNLVKELEDLSHTDELTGLRNRRGFFTLAEHLLKAAVRNKQGVYMLYADLDNLKDINDTWGHDKGDIALIEIGNILTKCYRESDVIARIGGDEFVIIPVGTRGDNIEMITARLQNALDAHNAKIKNSFKLAVSVGIAYYDAEDPCSIDELLTQADYLMYKNKEKKKDAVLQV